MLDINKEVYTTIKTYVSIFPTLSSQQQKDYSATKMIQKHFLSSAPNNKLMRCNWNFTKPWIKILLKNMYHSFVSQVPQEYHNTQFHLMIKLTTCILQKKSGYLFSWNPSNWSWSSFSAKKICLTKSSIDDDGKDILANSVLHNNNNYKKCHRDSLWYPIFYFTVMNTIEDAAKLHNQKKKLQNSFQLGYLYSGQCGPGHYHLKRCINNTKRLYRTYKIYIQGCPMSTYYQPSHYLWKQGTISPLWCYMTRSAYASQTASQ